MADPKYMAGVFINKKEFSNGGHVIKMDIIPEKLIEWLKNAPVTEKGYIKVQIQSKREPELDQFGNVKMFCSLDSYFHPDGGNAPRQQSAGGGSSTPQTMPSTDFDPTNEDDDIPFSPCVV